MPLNLYLQECLDAGLDEPQSRQRGWSMPCSEHGQQRIGIVAAANISGMLWEELLA